MLNRAYSLFDIKSVDDDQRIVEGFTSTPAPDRGGDILDPKGAEFSLPLPLLWQHNQKEPIGHVIDAKVTGEGIWIKAQIDPPGIDFIDRAWALIQRKLVRGFSVGWKPLEAPKFKGSIATFSRWLWAETSAVTIPQNSQATIALIKSLDVECPAATGTDAQRVLPSGVTERPRVVSTRQGRTMKSVSDQIKEFEATRQAKTARMTEIMGKSADSGDTLDETQAEEYDGLEADIETIDKHLVRLRKHEELLKTTAVPAEAKTASGASANRTGVITVRDNLPPGQGFVRSVIAKVNAFLDQKHAADVAREMFPHDDRLHKYLELNQKAAVPAGTSTHAVWAGPLVDQTNLASEFIEYLRPMTILGKFGTNGIPALRNVPFNIRVTGQTTGAVSQWVGEGRSKPVTSFGTEAITLLYTKIAALAVITEELARFSSPSAEMLVRDELIASNRERADVDFVDPANAGTANIKPASITNGVTPLTPSGTDSTAVTNDLVDLLAQFIENNLDPTNLVLIMPATLGMAVGMMRNSLGQREFPDVNARGGFLNNIPVITSQYAGNQSGAGNLVIAVNASEIFLADDGQVRVDVSREASIEMSDAPAGRSDVPTANTSVVSMFQTDSLALRSHRFINWRKRRTTAVSYLDDVNWGTPGSPG